jgi:hypothetical protein
MTGSRRGRRLRARLLPTPVLVHLCPSGPDSPRLRGRRSRCTSAPGTHQAGRRQTRSHGGTLGRPRDRPTPGGCRSERWTTMLWRRLGHERVVGEMVDPEMPVWRPPSPGPQLPHGAELASSRAPGRPVRRRVAGATHRLAPFLGVDLGPVRAEPLIGLVARGLSAATAYTTPAWPVARPRVPVPGRSYAARQRRGAASICPERAGWDFLAAHPARTVLAPIDGLHVDRRAARAWEGQLGVLRIRGDEWWFSPDRSSGAHQRGRPL